MNANVALCFIYIKKWWELELIIWIQQQIRLVWLSVEKSCIWNVSVISASFFVMQLGLNINLDMFRYLSVSLTLAPFFCLSLFCVVASANREWTTVDKTAKSKPLNRNQIQFQMPMLFIKMFSYFRLTWSRHYVIVVYFFYYFAFWKIQCTDKSNVICRHECEFNKQTVI